MKRISCLIFTTLLGLTGCSDSNMKSLSNLFQNNAESSESPVAVYPEVLTDDTYWSYFVGTYMDPTYAGYLKFSLELDDNGQIKTLIWNPNSYAYHADYLTTLPAYSGLVPAQIDAIALHDKGRRLLLGTALSIQGTSNSADEFDFQFVGEDPLTPDLIARAMKVLRSNLPKATAEKSFYLPAPQQIAYAVREASAFAAEGVKLAQRQATDDRVCYAGGWGAGYVKILNAADLETALKEGTIQSDEILVLESIPRELPTVAGIIIASPSSPSSHPALLAQMLGIPFFYEKDAMTSKVWQKYAASREPVLLKAAAIPYQGCEVLVRDGQSLQTNDVTALTQLKKPQPLALTIYDQSTPTAPLSLDSMGMNDGNRIGAKAANVAELRRLIPDNTVREGQALPLTAFAHFIETAKAADGSPLKARYEQILQNLSQANLSLSETLPLLTEIRTLIEKAKISKDQSNEILNGIEAVFPKATRIKLRSSSNMEDLPEFNGAGLYESKGACVGDDRLGDSKVGLCEAEPDEVLKAVKKVWSSLYSMKAWMARRTFSINETNVGMGVLIQRSYQGELANGVAIAQYPEQTYFGEEGLPDIEVVSTGFPGEDDSVTNPPPGKIPETIRIQKEMMEVTVASSEIPRGQKLLSDEANRSLYRLIETIYRHYEKIRNPSDKRSFVLDLEWKLVNEAGKESIIIKQVRPVPSPNQSTQGLGFGTMIVGEKKALLCPTVQENADALAKLKLSFPLQLAVDLHELKNDDSTAMKNPIVSLSAGGKVLALNSESTLSKEDWAEEWGTVNQVRYVTLNSGFSIEQENYSLAWKVRQTRTIAEKNRLLDPVQSLWSLDFVLSQGEMTQAYVLVVGQDSCDSDSFQGITPGAYNASLSYSQGRKPPVDFNVVYGSVTDKALDINIEAKTSFQGFDKTRFLGINKTTISGILNRPLVLSRGASVYAPAHHNFQWAYAFDALKAEGLTEVERLDLISKGIRYILLDNPGESYIDPTFFPKDGPLDDFGNPAPTIIDAEPREEVIPSYKVYGIDDSGKRTELGEVKQISSTNAFPIR
jgi:hypothetical protein